MKHQQLLIKLAFILAALSLILFSVVLDQGLTGLLIAFVFIAIAGVLAKKPGNRKSS